MHRSGTSAITQAIHRLGLPLGRPEDLFSAPDNPEGHFESNELCLVNDFILARLGGTWWAPPKLRTNWQYSRTATSLLPYLRTSFSDVYQSPLWLWKDPRLSLTLPLWLRVLPQVCAVVVIRDPARVARSLREREGFPFLYCDALWESYNRSACRSTARLGTIFINFDVARKDPRTSIAHLADDLGSLGIPLTGNLDHAISSVLPENKPHSPTSWQSQLTRPLWKRLREQPAAPGGPHSLQDVAPTSFWADATIAAARLWANRPDPVYSSPQSFHKPTTRKTRVSPSQVTAAPSTQSQRRTD